MNGKSPDQFGYKQELVRGIGLGDLVRLLSQATAPKWGVVALTEPPGTFNRVATELFHRLGAGPNVRVRGPVVLHAVPDSRLDIASLSDRHFRHLAHLPRRINHAVEGGPAQPLPRATPTPASELRRLGEPHAIGTTASSTAQEKLASSEHTDACTKAVTG